MEIKLNQMKNYLQERIKGQNHVLIPVVNCFQVGETGLMEKDRPKGSFLFLGPTGVGKTELTKAVSEYLFGDGCLHRFNMSEFMHFDSVKELKGSEDGRPGRLHRILNTYNKGIMLFDEMEKAHKLILDLFLQILDDGEVTLADGINYNLSNFYIVFTSNIGSAKIINAGKCVFTTIEKAVKNELISSGGLRPEFINRFDEVLVFKPLDYSIQVDIAKLNLEQEIKRLYVLKGCQLQYTDQVLQFVIRNGINRRYGARPLRRCIKKFITTAVKDEILKGNNIPSGLLKVDSSGRKIYLDINAIA